MLMGGKMPKVCMFFVLCAVLPFAANAASVASAQYVEQRLETTVSITGNQSIDGTKTYNESPIIPTPALPAE